MEETPSPQPFERLFKDPNLGEGFQPVKNHGKGNPDGIHKIKKWAHFNQVKNVARNKKSPFYDILFQNGGVNIRILFYHLFDAIPHHATNTTYLNEENSRHALQEIMETHSDFFVDKQVIRYNYEIQYVICDGYILKFDTYIEGNYLESCYDEFEKWLIIFDSIYLKHKTPSSKSINLVGVDAQGNYLLRNQTLYRENMPSSEGFFDNYNDDILPSHENIVKHFKKKKNSGVILLYGEPGTGKTSYIRNLLDTDDVNFILVNRNVAANLDSPQFTTFLANNCTNSVIIIEDAEAILKTREHDSHSPVSTLLNLGDGLLGDCLNITILCTFNAPKASIDPALMRKGRLVEMIEFKSLVVDKANALAEKIGSKVRYTSPQKLTDIYNFDQEEAIYAPNKRNAVGFGK